MEVNTSQEEGCYIIQVIGDLDASSSLLLDNELESAISSGHKVILIACHKLDYISSSRIGVFTSRIEEGEEKSITLALYGVSAAVLKVFSILGLDQLLPILENKDDVKAYINGLQENN